jgi:hypothetical protein
MQRRGRPNCNFSRNTIRFWFDQWKSLMTLSPSVMYWRTAGTTVSRWCFRNSPSLTQASLKRLDQQSSKADLQRATRATCSSITVERELDCDDFRLLKPNTFRENSLLDGVDSVGNPGCVGNTATINGAEVVASWSNALPLQVQWTRGGVCIVAINALPRWLVGPENDLEVNACPPCCFPRRC